MIMWKNLKTLIDHGIQNSKCSYGQFKINHCPLSTTMTLNKAQCRQNYDDRCEAQVNKQINLELYASYVYMSIAYYFDRNDVAFEGLFNHFQKNSLEERGHAEKFMKYQNSRGGRLIFEDIRKPAKNDWSSPMVALLSALDLEKVVNQALLDLHGLAGRQGDPHLCDFLEREFLDEQVREIKQLSDYLTQLQRCGNGLGEYLFDKNFKYPAP